MRNSGAVILIHVLLLVAAVMAAGVFSLHPLELGRLALQTRALLAAVPLMLFLAGLRPFLPWLSRQPAVYLLAVCLPLAGLVFWYYLAYLPAASSPVLSGEQTASSLITENTSNPIVEVGFSYPIYTPTIRLGNDGLFTRDVDVFLRIIDGNNEPALFRAVRTTLPDSRLSVEASVHGLLSESPGYLFIPLQIPPRGSVSGRVVFIISDLNDGSTFNEALGRAYPAEFQIRDPESGELLLSFPMTRI
jgi:hypothetical protein